MSRALPNPAPPSHGTSLLSYQEARALVDAHAIQLGKKPPSTERVALGAASGRVLAEPLHADRDQPPFARSTRDGFACRAAEASKHKFLKLAGQSRAGDAPAGPLPEGHAWEIMTGAPIPPGADAVVMIEHVETSARKVRLLPPRTVKPGENIVEQAAQARQGDLLLPVGSSIHAAQIALAAACGYAALVSDDNDRGTLLVESVQQLEDRLAVHTVEVARRFVGKHDRGMSDERPGDGDTLTLAARQLSGASCGTLRKPYLAQGL